MLKMSRSVVFRLLPVAALLMAGLYQATPSTADYRAPVDITFPTVPDARFTDDYDAGRSAGRAHRATDLFAPMGAPVYAAVGGRVTWLPGRHPSAGFSIHVRGEDGRLYAYYHLGPHGGSAGQAYAPGIAEGVTVRRGQHIGFLGDSGNAAGGTPHLHFEIHDDRIRDPYGTNRINPFRSLTEAVRRGDVVGRVGTPAASRDGQRTPVLRMGDRGPAVAEWQHQLNTVANAGLVTDGIFGPATDRATRSFQQSRGITVDGIVGPQTRSVASGQIAVPVSSPPTAPAPGAGDLPPPTGLLRLGDRGPYVAQWQGQLNTAISANLAVDGIFGPATDRATRELQRARGITVDGIVGPQTRNAL
jgi:peptidoglycan hydrolase-like protein with peptidoglycan-binding domain